MKIKRIISVLLCLVLSLGAAALTTGAALPQQNTGAAETSDQAVHMENGGFDVLLDGNFSDLGTVTTVPQPADSHSLLLQISNNNVLKDGEMIAPASGFGAPLAPYYDGSLSMVPLRFVAETFGYTITWEEITQKVAVTGNTLNVSFSVSTDTEALGGTAASLDATAVITGDSVYVPARAFCQILGLYIHYFDRNNGEFLLITDYPVSSGDLTGDENADYTSVVPDENLLSFKNLGDALLGPSRSMYENRTLTLMCGSPYAVRNGAVAAITETGAGSVATIKSAGGATYVPLLYCASCFGIGNDVVSSLETLTFDGVLYAEIQAFAAVSGLYSVALDPDIWILSEYDLTKYDDLTSFADADASQLRSLPAIKGYVAMTFDDGPTGKITTRLLDGLRERNVHATFFLCGSMMALYPDLLPRYIADGHELGNHSSSHPQMTRLSSGAAAAEIDRANETIAQYAGSPPTLFRPPYGDYNQTVLSELESRSMACIMWSVGLEDYLYSDSRPIVNSILSQAGDGDIIILHDSHGASVDAGLKIIDTLQSEGYKIVTVSDLAFIKGYSLSAGGVYRHF